MIFRTQPGALGVHTLEHERAAWEVLLHKARWLDDDGLPAKRTMEAALGRLLRGFRKQDRTHAEGELRQTPRLFFATSIDTRWERDDAHFLEGQEGTELWQ